MTSVTTEPPTLRSFPSVGGSSSSSSAASHRRSYRCYNCSHSFYITPTANASASSPSSFRCPRCFHRHLIPHHTISPPPPPPSPPPPPTTFRPIDFGIFSNFYIDQTSDESDSGDESDSDSSLLAFTSPNIHPKTPALKSFVSSLPIKIFPPNSNRSLQSCSICMEDFEIDPGTFVTVNKLPCEHYFHKNCIVEWLQRSNTCPLCRYKLPAEPTPKKKVIDPWAHQWEDDPDTLLLLNIAPVREPMLRRVNGEANLSSIAAASRSGRRVSSANGGEISRRDVDEMRDEDGDILMVDA